MGQQFLDVVHITAVPEAHCVRFRFIGVLLCWPLYLVQTGTKSFIDDRSERLSQFSRQSSRLLDQIIVYCQGRSHTVSLSSSDPAASQDLPC
jgi:hypothetical protein